MKIRTIDKLFERVDSERIWRIRELSAFSLECRKHPENSAPGSALRRGFVPLAYAHWEGFAKVAAHLYLEFVAMQGLRLCDLSPCFVSMYLWKEFQSDIQRGKLFSLTNAAGALKVRSQTIVRLQFRDAISTQSNLNSDVLRDICSAAGFNWNAFNHKALFIDAHLLSKRNNIAHGEWQNISKDDVEVIKEGVTELIDLLKTEIENSVAEKRYMAVE